MENPRVVGVSRETRGNRQSHDSRLRENLRDVACAVAHEAVNFLEIGLGCDMTYGPGKSLSLWEEYFTHRDARVSFLEVDGVCVKNHAIKLRNGTIFVGSQEDESVLRNIAAEGHAVGGYDVWGHEWTVLLGILEGADIDHRLNRSAVLTVGSTQDGGLLECRYAQDDTKRLNVSEILLSAFVPFHDRVSSDT